MSVVIPCFNAETTIRESIESALGQHYKPMEIIVLNDGSTDNSLDIISSYGKALRIVSGPNQGVSHTRNQGTKLARGEFIQYLDSDDLLVDGTIQLRVDALIDLESDVAYTDWQTIPSVPEGDIQHRRMFSEPMESIDADAQIACATSFWAPPAAVLYKRKIVDAIGGWNESLPVIQDARFLFDAAYHGGRFVHVPCIGAYYREGNEDSLSQRSEYGFVQDVVQNADDIRSLWGNDAVLSEKQKNALIGIYDYAARSLFKYDEIRFRSSVSAMRELGAAGGLRYVSVASFLTNIFGMKQARKIMGLLQAIKKSLD